MEEREAIRKLYRKYWQCMIAKDADGLRRLMADDYVLLHIAKLDRNERYYHRTDAQLLQFAAWRPQFEQA